MTPLELLFRSYQIHSLDECESKNFGEICEQHEYDFLGKGFFSRAFRVRDSEWVIKEWRWDIDIPLIFGTKNIHGQPLQKLLSPFSYKFLPTKEEAWRQYQEYLLLVRYFGYFDTSYDYYPQYESIAQFQKWLRWNLDIFRDILIARFDIKLSEDFSDKLPILHNFLPREYMGYWVSVSPENKGKKTSYIAQEFIKGVPFSEKKIEDFSEEELKQIYLLCILILICYIQTGKIPDTRPTSDPKHWGQWFLHTENIFVTENGGVKMVDTRWLWNVDENIIKRGIMIPELILQSVIRATKKIGKILS
jgi:hypothetical protein